MKKFRMEFSPKNLDKLLRLKRVASPRILFPSLPAEHIERLAGVPNGKPAMIWDEAGEGLNLLVAAGPADRADTTVTFRVCFAEPGKASVPRYRRLGTWPRQINDPAEARRMGDAIRAKARAGEAVSKEAAAAADAKAEAAAAAALALAEADRLDVMVDRFVRFKRAEGIASWREVEGLLTRYVLPEWGKRNVRDIRKRDVADLLERIRNGEIASNGRMIGTPSTSAAVFAQLNSFFGWFADTQEEGFSKPLSRRMCIGKPQPRDRVLSDGELKLLWPTWEAGGVYGALMRVALLSAGRFRKVAGMLRTDLHPNFIHNGVAVERVWNASRPNEPKNKHNSLVPMSALCWTIVQSLPIVDNGPYVFSDTGSRSFRQFYRRHTAVMAELQAQGTPIEWFQGRDLRRSARTLMARCGIANDIAEHALGHSVGGIIRQTYDRHSYLREKADAFERVAALVTSIVEGGQAQRSHG